ncbi:hypothetical protein CANTEDRAFT_114707 [Yamadazyma tenuis ATCC 10573]|uniref:Uncharacterized protein n=1 Tax=Candida tenuis (strain ATCC 10573 / BCRC 21748 / CBS 615 / JCM 9827 / NBRC 10315 / NRRL Y-1498 / VKM Y-70) TaxID=590646 RepID=G3B665_CANTC|nr:uncharacterized protein CANTEDRAFT_114707 [Yamadazyma tenuis ATCC 10573]EGV63394.1 hypothetical protein CANTEDRAFT_114707 [Yamadazyma tenuis ATCC 10573]
MDRLTLSQELCSSSWGQFDGDDDYTLLYVTSHQLENWSSIPKFQEDLRNKFTIRREVRRTLAIPPEVDPTGEENSDQENLDQEIQNEDSNENRNKRKREEPSENDQNQEPNPKKTPANALNVDFPEDEEDNEEDEEEIPEEETEDQPRYVRNKKILRKTIEKNPLFIQAALAPPVLISPVHNEEFREPKYGWMRQHQFAHGQGHPYWCAYDIVGSPQSTDKARVEEYGRKLQYKYLFILDVWLNMGAD